MLLLTGSKIDAIQLENKHPDYDYYNRDWQFYRDAYECDGGFKLSVKRLTEYGTWNKNIPKNPDRSYLVRYSAETPEKYNKRQLQSYLRPVVKLRCIDPLVGFLVQKKPDRSHYPNFILDWMNSVTEDGQEFDNYLSRIVVPYGLIYGKLPIIVDSDQHDAQTEAERIAGNYRTGILKEIHPTNLLDWYEENGDFVGLKYETNLSVWDPIEGHELFRRVRWITNEGTFYVDVFEDRNNFQYVINGSQPWSSIEEGAPIVTAKFFNGAGIGSLIAPTIHQIFNLESWLTESEFCQAFNILAVPMSIYKQLEQSIGVGTTMALPIPEDARIAPQYIAPNPDPMTHLKDRIESLTSELQEIIGTSSTTAAGVEAAATHAYRFQLTEKLLKQLIKDVIRFESRVILKVASLLGQPLSEPLFPIYDQSFDAMHVERFMQNFELGSGLGLPATAKKVGKRKIIDGLDLWGDKEEKDQITEELEQGVADDNAMQTGQQQIDFAQQVSDLNNDSEPTT